MDSIPLNLGFHAKYILSPRNMLFHPVNVLLKGFEISFKSSQGIVIRLGSHKKTTPHKMLDLFMEHKSCRNINVDLLK